MMSSKKALVSIGLVIGAVGIGASASALVGAAEDPVVEGPTTTVEETTTTETSTTAPTTTSESTTTVVEPATTVAPVTTEAPTTTVAPVVAANAFGQCTAFSGRSQPGNSQAWQRLYDAAGGDIEGYCAQVFAGRGDDIDAEPETDPPVEEPSDEPSEDAGSGSDAERTGNGHGNGKGKSGR